MPKAFTAVSCALALLALSACTQASLEIPSPLAVAPLPRTGSDARIGAIKITATPTSTPQTMMVYRVKRPHVRREEVQRVAAGLGLLGPAEETELDFRVRGPHASLVIDKETGSFDYTTDGLEHQTAALEVSLSDAEYRAHAERFLEGHGLMKERAVFRDVNRNMVGVYEGGRWIEKPYLVEVRFGHEPLGGVPFDKGVGPKIVVQFGEGAEVLGALSVWREVEPYRAVPVLDPKSALSQARQGEAQVFSEGEEAQGRVTDVEFAYLNDPLGGRQEFVIPHYFMRGRSSKGKAFGIIARGLPASMLKIDESLSSSAP